MGRNSSSIWLLFLLGAATAVNYLDRQIINVLAQDIKLDLGLSDTQLGLLTGAAFGLSYSVLALPMGWLVDRWNRIHILSGALFTWSMFTAGCGIASSLVQLMLMRFGVSVGEAACLPAASSLIPDAFRGSRRSLATGVLMMGAPLGSLLGLLLGGYFAGIYGWRITFLIAAIPGIVLAALFLLSTSDPIRERHARQARERGVGGGGGQLLSASVDLFRLPGFAAAQVALGCAALQVYASGAWFPVILKRVFALSTAQVGLYGAFSVGVGGLLGTIGAALVVGHFKGRHGRSPLIILISCLTLTIPALLFAVLSPWRELSLAAMLAFNLFAYAYLAPLVEIIQDLVPPTSRGLAVALATSVAGIFSLAIGIPLIGAISDLFTPSLGTRAASMAMTTCAVAAAVGVIAYIKLLKTGATLPGRAARHGLPT